MNMFLKAAAGAALCTLAATGASAAVATNLGNCSTSGVFAAPFTYLECAGAYAGNVLNNSNADTQKDALAQLGVDVSGFDFNSFFKIDSLNGADAVLPPEQTMYGITIFGIHFGASSVLGNATGFYKFDAGNGTNTIPFATKGSSGFVLYGTGTPPTGGVPEPATWAMLIAGFGLVGSAMRRRRSTVAHVAA